LTYRNTESLQTRVNGASELRSIVMWDLALLALGLGFFAAGIGYAYACERL
jgi:hypothetical protein